MKALKPFIGKRVIHHAKLKDIGTIKGKSAWITTIDHRDVILLCVAGSWAWVRRPKCNPYTCRTREITPITA